MVLAVAWASCAPAPSPTSSVAPPVASPSVAASSPSPEPVHDAAPHEPQDSGATAEAPPDAGPDAGEVTVKAPSIACKTTDDCWVKKTPEGERPARRPANLRGVKVKPCGKFDSIPVCKAGECGLVGFGC